MNQSKEQIKIIKKRNKRLEKFFQLVCLELQWDKNSFEIIGDINNPIVILNDKHLSCYVHNFNLNFMSKPSDGEILYTEKLVYDQNIKLAAFISWLNTVEHRQLYKIHLTNTPLYLSGYNFKGEKGDDEGKYPVFSEYGYKKYFDFEYAKSIVDDYSTENLKLEVI